MLVKSPLKILHVAESIRGGVGSYLNYLLPLQIEELGEQSLRVLAPDTDADHLSALADSGVVKTYRRRGRTPASLLRLALATAQAIRHFRPDIVHLHSSFAGAAIRTLLADWPNRPKIVYCAHGWAFDTQATPSKTRFYEWTERKLAHIADRIVTISDYEKQRAAQIGIDEGRMTTILNGIPASPPAAQPARWADPRLKLLFVGRLDRQKGVDILIDAVRDLDRHVSVRIVGAAVADGENAIPILPHVETMGWKSGSEIQGLMDQADLVVMPSRWEGFGLVAVEAMRAGKPVFASAVGGLTEIIVDQVTGRLLPPADPAALRQALLQADRRQLRDMGDAGRLRFRQFFTADRMHEQLMMLYRYLMMTGRLRIANENAPAGQRPLRPARKAVDG